MGLKELIAAHTAALYLDTDRFAETVTYTPSGGEGASMAADVGPMQITEEQEEGRLIRVGRREFMLCTDPAADCGGIADVSTVLDASITYDGATYAIERVIWRDEASKTIGVMAKTYLKQEMGRPGLRRSTRW